MAFNHPPSSSSSIMLVNAGLWANEEAPHLLTTSQRTKALLLFPEHHHPETHAEDLHLVPDEDDIYQPHHPHDYYSQVAPRVARKTNLFDLEKPPAPDHDHDHAALVIHPAVPDAADYKDLVVPHHDDSDPRPQAAASNKHANEAGAEAEAALVPSLSVCSNDPPDQDQVQSVREEAPEKSKSKNKNAKRKYARPTSTEINKKMRTLQGLIPNCNDKVDKASILDDAIVYVKALQLQLQMMSMPPMHLSYLPTTPAAAPAFPMLGFPPFVPLLVPHPSISLSNSINSNLSNHLFNHHQR